MKGARTTAVVPGYRGGGEGIDNKDEQGKFCMRVCICMCL